MPYSVWPVIDLEAGLQIMSKHGIANVIKGKVNDGKFRAWDWHPYLMQQYSDMYPLARLLDDDYDGITKPMIAAQREADARKSAQR
jgi:hypothetical protein